MKKCYKYKILYVKKDKIRKQEPTKSQRSVENFFQMKGNANYPIE